MSQVIRDHMLKCDKSNNSSNNGSVKNNYQMILKESYWGLQHCRQEGEVKWQDAIPSKNYHNIADNIGLINY